MKQIEKNNVLWDAENLKMDGREYFAYHEALAIAESLGKRLPTREEYIALMLPGYVVDYQLEGMWFGGSLLSKFYCCTDRIYGVNVLAAQIDSYNYPKDSAVFTGSLFFPKRGFIRYSRPEKLGVFGYYWFFTPENNKAWEPFSLSFAKSPSLSGFHSSCKLSVRLVQDAMF